MRFVLANLADPELSVRLVCRQLRISPRSLHALFADQERTFGRTVREIRLGECARRLAVTGPGVSVTSVAARYGFVDPAGFSRAFRRRFGMAPREVLGRPDRLAQLGLGAAGPLGPGAASPLGPGAARNVAVGS
jgi:AraC-like DNA-binding protein